MRPNRRAWRSGGRRWKGFCASFAGEDDPCALSAAAYLLWWHGQNSSAARYVREALAADADYPLAQLLADSLSGMVQPGWLLADRQGET